MSLNINNEEAHHLAVHLAELTGETITKAVTVALQERIDRVQDSGISKKSWRAQEIIRRSGDAEPYQERSR